MKKLNRSEFAERMKNVKLLALDVDGVLTDDSIYFGPDGFELKKFNISDGFYMVLAMRAGLELAVVSGRYSAATDSRMKDLGVKHVLQEMKSKVEQITPLLKKLGLEFSEVAFVGNELLDVGLARRVGLPIAVADAVDELKEVAAYVTEKRGGNGAVREILECYFEGSSKDPGSYII
jgi:3-deoxy-D-manno-octulosonate 8-phosphate phosphatase (KDO 8-P phosphatase)